MEALGICAGASTISMVRLQRDGNETQEVWSRVQSHEGNARRTILSMLDAIEDLSRLRIAVTGRKFRNLLNLSTLSEPEALELAAKYVLKGDRSYRTFISAGGETFMVYFLDAHGRVQEIHTGNKCASGTGEFLLQQLNRMGLSLTEVESMEVDVPSHRVSGRCSVFCKSDCTHALNKGVPKYQVVSGLARMMAGKCLELLKKLPKEKVVLVGGCSKNSFMVRFLQNEIKDLLIPKQAPRFEALGAALWAMENEPSPYPGREAILRQKKTSFSYLDPLAASSEMVEFKPASRSRANPGDLVILGLDVGSTTTKGVLMRMSDSAILAADYLRTQGDPVGASRRIYASLQDQVDVQITIQGLGVTGSGRAIAGLHAQTEGVINEIIAHAAAAVHFDPEVDTIFEIGGQDAKYTSITNMVPSDYAMNEACSAGTGSFLEESAKESLGVEMEEIGRIAYQGKNPPNFNDQCAAFISSDIKIATQEGLPLEDIIAGLVYSICMNYNNRVKGNRPVGQKVFMQGGVCYNEAVPAAMAALTGKRIVVPPDPGLMGALGVALEVQRRMEQGLISPGRFDLADLAARQVHSLPPFTCKGGKEKCDRGCEIARIRIGDKVFPFGGICNRYDNIVNKRKVDETALDFVSRREQKLFGFPEKQPAQSHARVGLNRSFLMNTYYPLFATFLSQLGFEVVLPDRVDPEGVDLQGSSFCFPGELAHGFLADLLKKKPDYLLMPHIRAVPKKETGENSFACVLVQGETYYLRSAFPELDPANDNVFTPVIDFSQGIPAAQPEFLKIAAWLGKGKREARDAFAQAVAEQERFSADLKDMGREALEELDANPEETAVVLFGRPYNAFAGVANKAIPAKFATRGVRIIPFDMLPFENEPVEKGMHMYWGLGRMILQASRFVANHPQLFGAYITNFSCGPDSFLVGYFREIMAKKPSLTLELDSHTADAGIETRIEAFLDIVQFYRRIGRSAPPVRKPFFPARLQQQGDVAGVVSSGGKWLPLTDERVKLVFPSLNAWGTKLVCKSLSSGGIRAEAIPPADEGDLKLGRGNSSCKECLPLQLTVGSMLNYLKRREPAEVTLYFMPGAGGPCRFGQYSVFSRKLIERKQIPDATVFSTSSQEGYGGLGQKTTLRAWRAIVIGDLLEEMQATVLAAAKNREHGFDLLEQEYRNILDVVDREWKVLATQLEQSARLLSTIELKLPFEEIPKISLVGEIFVRHDPIARQGLVERLADKGFIVRTSQVTEWIKYTDWLVRSKMEGKRDLGFWISQGVKWYFDRVIREKLAPSGLFHNHVATTEELIKSGSPYISPMLNGEAILTVGAAFHEILEPACGIISIGPFGCMPSRLAEAVLSEKFTTAELRAHRNGPTRLPALQEDRKLPFLAIETDGNPFPQVIEARLEAFCLQAERLNRELLSA